MPLAVPEALLNVKIHFLINSILAVVLFVFQILSLASDPKGDPYEKIGIGFWGGLVIAFAGVVSLKATANNSQFLLGCSFVLAIFAFILSFAIMGIFAAAIDWCKRTHGDFTGLSVCSPALVGFDSIMLICGIIGIPVNALLIVGVVSAYEPPASAPTP